VKLPVLFVVVFAILFVLPWLFGRIWEMVRPNYLVYVRGSPRGFVIFAIVCAIVAYAVSRLLMKYLFKAG
jgi:hypothetical protein